MIHKPSKTNMKILYTHKVAFKTRDPLANGLSDEIAAEQREKEAIQLEEQFDETLADKWDDILNDLHKDSEWVEFSKAE